jgi:hypothetical protein|tara:strand:- start:610 stop:783 length:174 start_codon:yes stop_codon:yes gene_type:complete
MIEQDIQERLKSLEAQRIQMEANLNAIGGAIQDCHFWLDKITSSTKNVVKIKGSKGD